MSHRGNVPLWTRHIASIGSIEILSIVFTQRGLMLRSARVLFVLLTCLAFCAPARAQFESGSVVGTVRDTTGAVVPDAAVTLLSPDTGVEVKWQSGGDGTFEFVTVRPASTLTTERRA